MSEIDNCPPERHKLKRSFAIAGFFINVVALSLAGFDIAQFKDILVPALSTGTGLITIWATGSVVVDGFGTR